MNRTEGLVKFFMARRKCGLPKAQYLADQVIIKRKLELERKTEKLEKAQLTLGLVDDMPKEEPTNRFEPDDPTVDF